MTIEPPRCGCNCSILFVEITKLYVFIASRAQHRADKYQSRVQKSPVLSPDSAEPEKAHENTINL